MRDAGVKGSESLNITLIITSGKLSDFIRPSKNQKKASMIVKKVTS